LQVSKKLTKKQIDAVFAKFDGNGDGKLSREEFQQLMSDRKK
jgi:Ca2+-binding EF-hand superfamily protein